MIPQYTLLEKIVIVAIMVLFVLVAVLPLQGCSPAHRTNSPSAGPLSGAQASVKAVYKTNWMLSLATLGVAGSMFAMMMGLSKIGLAGLVASVAASAYTVATIRYSWLVALAGLCVGLLAAMAGFVKNKKTIFSFISGVQDIKRKLRTGQAVQSHGVNSTMAEHLTPEAERMVTKYKSRSNQHAHTEPTPTD